MSGDRRQSGLWSRNPDTGYFEQAPIPTAHIQPKGPYAYYEPPTRQSHQQQSQRFSFSERAGPSQEESLISTVSGDPPTKPQKERDSGAGRDVMRKVAEPVNEMLNKNSVTTKEQLAATKHVNSTSLPGSAQQPSLSVDPDYVPGNLRASAWSPDIQSPKQRSRQASNASSRNPDIQRKGAVPGQSPLQNLENWSKEEKRARVQQAEHKVRQRTVVGQGEDDLRRSATLRSERGRVVSDDVARTASQHQRTSDRRQVSDPASPDGRSATERFTNTSEALRSNGRSSNFSTGEATARSASTVKPEAAQNLGGTRHRQGDNPSPLDIVESSPRLSNDINRSQSGKYKHRARDAGFAGAAAAYTVGQPISSADSSAGQGKVAHDRRQVSVPDAQPLADSAFQADGNAAPEIGRSGSKKLQKRPSPSGDYKGRDQLQSDRSARGSGKRNLQAANAYQDPDPIPPSQVQNQDGTGVKYSVPPLTAAAQQANQQVGFHPDVGQREKHHRFGDMFHRREHRGYMPSAKPLEEWRQAKTARLTRKDLEFEQNATASAKEDSAWWEKGKPASTSSANTKPKFPQKDEQYEEQAQKFEPFLFLHCGPLLRYTGIRKEASRSSTSNSVEVWRGSIMIVTDDSQSDLSRTPVLRLFAQPMELFQAPPAHLLESGQDLPPDYEDPVAGQVKLSRTGRPVYVRPVDDIDGEVDLSRQENNQGLFSATRYPVLGPQATTGADGRQSHHITFQNRSRVSRRDGEKAGRYREVKAARLHTERGFTFWRFNVEVELGKTQTRVAYRVNNGPAIGFWVPARGETMNIMFHSCNGFSMSVDSNKFSGPDPLWRDVLHRHQSRPFHVMIGGGDQVYNDAAMRDTVLFKEWLASKNLEHKHSADFSPEMQDELESFYLNRYSMWFSQGLFGMANSQIPMVNIWDDHDIIDGYGSYPHHFMSTRIFTGLGAIAFKYYMLFQHQSLPAETEKEEPSWLLGQSPGPYIGERSRSIFLPLGNKVHFLGLDCRTERMRDEVLSAETYNKIFDRCRDEIVKGQTKHLIVLLGVPIAYPRLNFLENVLTSRAMAPIKALGKTGILGGFVNKFDGGVEILDDLDDHWTAKHHKGERNWFIEELQEIAAEKSVRVTILGGDVHLGAVGQFFSPKKLGLAKDRDHRYMPNIISSAIVNTPPPTAMADVLNRRNKIHHLNTETDENMIPMFSHDVDGSKRNNHHLMPRRNFCIIREYMPGSTPPSTPVMERTDPGTPMSGNFGETQTERASRDRKFPPGSMKRTMSLTRGPVGLVRRLSGSSKTRKPAVSLAPEQTRPYNNEDRPLPQRANSLNIARQDGYFPSGATAERPTFTFHRRPTDLSEKEAKKATIVADDTNADGVQSGHVNLEGGLDISLCMEVDQRDPNGTTIPYRLLVPALWYEETGPPAHERFKSHRGSFMDRLLWNRKRETPLGAEHDDDWTEHGGAPSLPSQDDVTEQNTAANALGLTGTGRGAYGRAGPYNASGYYGTGPKDATPRAPKGVNGREISAPIPQPRQPAQGPGNAYSRGYDLSSPPIGAYTDRQQAPQTMQSQYQTQTMRTGPYSQPGDRKPSVPNQSQPRAAPRASEDASRTRQQANYDEYHSDGSLTPSEEYFDGEEEPQRPSPPARRPSKVDRFLGFGDVVRDAVTGGGRRRSMQNERQPAQLQQHQQQHQEQYHQQQQQQQQHDDSVRYSADVGRPMPGDLGRGGSVKKPANWKIWKKGWYDGQREQ